jgi:hypothetical protein
LIDSFSGEIEYEYREAPRHWESSNYAPKTHYEEADSQQSPRPYENQPSGSWGPYQESDISKYQKLGAANHQTTYQTDYSRNPQESYDQSSWYSSQPEGQTFGTNSYQHYASQSQTNQGYAANKDSLPQSSGPLNLARSQSAPVKVTVSTFQLFTVQDEKVSNYLVYSKQILF